MSYQYNKVEIEPLIDPKNKRINLFPIEYEDVWQFYKQSVASFWVPEEITLVDDMKDWEKLPEEEKHFILMVLGFFAASDFIVNENLDEGFCEHITVPEVKMFYHAQEFFEDIHTTTYQLLIETYVRSNDIKKKLLNSVVEIPSIRKKAEWARSAIIEKDFVGRLLAFCCVEGIMFSASFAAIFYCKKRGILPGLSFSNSLIARDEGMHRDFACLLYKNYIINKWSRNQVVELIKSAVDVEKDFVKESLPYYLAGMNKDLMCQYVEYVADHLLVSLGYEKEYNTENPFPWMILTGMDQKSNFFEVRVSSYAKQSILATQQENQISFNDDF